MPAYGIDFVDRADLLTYEEMHRVLRIVRNLGITKLRITGGEPFVRRGLIDFLERVHQENTFNEIHLTTNATLTESHLDRFGSAGIQSVNISLDTLNRERFFDITRRDKLPTVLNSIDSLYHQGIKLKINMVVMAGSNADEIVDMARLAQTRNIDVRFLEEMPFNGTENGNVSFMDYRDIRTQLENELGQLHPKQVEHGQTATVYSVDGFQGTLGIIPSFSRTFCGTCNRLRITPKGLVKTCLYGKEVMDLRNLLRFGASDDDIAQALMLAVQQKPKNGFEAEADREADIHASMATIGG